MPTDTPGGRKTNPYVLLFWAALLYVFISSYDVISPILLSLLLIILISIALNPAVAALRRRLGKRSIATGIIVLIFLFIAGLTAWGVYQPVKKSTSQFVERLPQYWERIQRPLMKIQQKAVVSEQKIKQQVTTEIIQEDVAKTNKALASSITNAPPALAIPRIPQRPAPQENQAGFIQSSLSHLLTGVAGSFRTIAMSTFETFVIAVTVFVGVVFSLINPRPLIAFTYSIVPEEHHVQTSRIIQRIMRIIPQWALATVLGMAVIGTMVFFAMWVVLGFQDALVLGLVAFVLEAVPYVGPLLAVVPALLLSFGEGGMTPLWVLLAYACIQALENNVVAPLIMAERLRLHPVAVLFSILTCAIIFGVLGALLATPLVVVVSILHQELFRPRFLPNVSDADLENLAKETLKSQREGKEGPATGKLS